MKTALKVLIQFIKKIIHSKLFHHKQIKLIILIP